MRFFLGLILGGIGGTILGALLMLGAFPFLFPPPMVNETVAEQYDIQPILLGSTSFRQNVAGHDAAHWGRGDIKIYQRTQDKYVIEFQANFEVGPGPNFWLYLNSQPDIDDEDGFQADAQRARLTKIKSFQGSQVYEVPAAAVKDAKALTIWCESFHQYIASANLDLSDDV